MIHNRLSACGPRALFALELLSVAARPVDVELLPGLLEQPSSVTAEALAELRDCGLVLSRSGTVSVVHDLLREAIATGLSHERAQQLNLTVARWLERNDEPVVLLAAPSHRRAAGQAVGELVARILASPRRGWLGADGTTQLVDLVSSGMVDPDPELLTELAQPAGEVGEPATALPLWARVADGPGAATLRFRAAVEAGRSAYELVDRETAWRWLRRARSSAVEDVGHAVALEVVESHVLRWLESRFDEAAACSARAMQLVDAATGGDNGEEVRSARVQALSALGDDAMVRGTSPPSSAAPP